jgi:transposase-like protein
VAEQRYQAVLAVISDGLSISQVAQRVGVSRQTLHSWLGRYEAQGLEGLVDRSHRPMNCPRSREWIDHRRAQQRPIGRRLRGHRTDSRGRGQAVGAASVAAVLGAAAVGVRTGDVVRFLVAPGGAERAPSGQKTAEDLLADRYARGEIDAEEYRQRAGLLSGRPVSSGATTPISPTTPIG